MKFNLICSDQYRTVIRELLGARQIKLDDAADVFLVEKGIPLGERGVSIVFDPDNLEALLGFLDQIGLQNTHGDQLDVLTVKRGSGFEVLPIDQIFYFEANGNDVYCQTELNRFEIRKKLYDLEERLGPKGFTRISKSLIINILKVNEILPWFGGCLLLNFKEIHDELKVSRRYVSAFKKFLGL